MGVGLCGIVLGYRIRCVGVKGVLVCLFRGVGECQESGVLGVEWVGEGVGVVSCAYALIGAPSGLKFYLSVVTRLVAHWLSRPNALGPQ